jgi:hypothetical protein
MLVAMSLLGKHIKKTMTDGSTVEEYFCGALCIAWTVRPWFGEMRTVHGSSSITGWASFIGKMDRRLSGGSRMAA